MKTNNFKYIALLPSLFAISLFGQESESTANVVAEASNSAQGQSDWLMWILIVTVAALAIVILFMGSLLSRVAIMKMKATVKKAAVWMLFLSAGSLMAESGVDTGFTLSKLQLYMIIMGVVIFEVLIILYFANWLRALVLPPKPKAENKFAAWSKWWDKVNNSVEIENEKDVQLDHDYDGIKELDNALPPWWVYGFYLTIIFAGIYTWRYHISETAPLQVEELNIAIAKAEIQQAEYNRLNANNVDENSIEYKADAGMIASGKALFEKKCVACHADGGKGNTGPNLTDNYWKHGGTIKDIFRTITHGVPNMGMIAWKDQLSAKEIAELSNYVRSLRGTNVEGGKEPEGQFFKAEEPAASGVDSSEVSIPVEASASL